MSQATKPSNNSSNRTTNHSRSPLSTTSSSSSLTNEQHAYVAKIQNNKSLNRSKPYSATQTNKNKSVSPAPSTSTSSSLTSSPTSGTTTLNNNYLTPPPAFPFDPLVLAALQKYYAALASATSNAASSVNQIPSQQQSQLNYGMLSNLAFNDNNNKSNGMLSNCIQQQAMSYLQPKTPNSCPDPTCTKCQSTSTNDFSACTIPGCTQCVNHLNVSTTSNSSNSSNSSTSPINSPVKLVSPTSQHPPIDHYCNWLSGGNMYCGKKFSTIDQLNEHIKTHTTAELVSDLTRYHNIRSSLLNNQQLQQQQQNQITTLNIPFFHSSNQATQLHNNRLNPYLKPTPMNNLPSPTNQMPYLAYHSTPNLSTLTTPNFYSQLALLTNNL